MFLALIVSSIPHFVLKFKKSGDEKVKKIIGCLFVMTFFTAALIVGCNGSNPSTPGGFTTATPTPASYAVTQATPQAKRQELLLCSLIDRGDEKLLKRALI